MAERKSKNQDLRMMRYRIVCYEMESGVSESEAYRRFGERCGQVKYKTFATLLIQNLQKGSRQMADMLERESMEAWEERKRKATGSRRSGSNKITASHDDDACCCDGNRYDSCVSVLLWRNRMKGMLFL